MAIIQENSLIERLTQGFGRSALQLNGLNESDAELIRLPGTDVVLAVTTDAIVEEIQAGLYSDPYLLGWMTVMVNASDLAAVGAEPIGILLNETLTDGLGEAFVSRIQQGIEDACVACDLAVLGGDTNFSRQMQMAASALGIVPDGIALTRLGATPGDTLFASGPLGLGTAFALCQLAPGNVSDLPTLNYQPTARLREGRLLRGLASCCMDTSDGVLATLDQLMRCNDVGFVIELPAEDFLHSDANRISQATGIPPWMMLAGPHGEFELLFTMPADRLDDLVSEAAAHGWAPIRLGRVVAKPGISLPLGGKLALLDTGRIRNLFAEANGDIEKYLSGLYLIDECSRAA